MSTPAAPPQALVPVCPHCSAELSDIGCYFAQIPPFLVLVMGLLSVMPEGPTGSGDADGPAGAECAGEAAMMGDFNFFVCALAVVGVVIAWVGIAVELILVRDKPLAGSVMLVIFVAIGATFVHHYS